MIKKIQIGLTSFGLLIIMLTSVSASSAHVIYQVEWVAENAGIVQLQWNDATMTTPIMIQGWTQAATGEVIIRYATGQELPTGFDERRIEVDNLKAPFRIVLVDATAADTNIFTDMPSSNEGVQAIQMLYDLGVLNGYSDGTIKPDNSVSRAEFSKMLFMATHMSMAPTGTAPGFSDVPLEHWAKTYIGTLASKGIVQGKGNNTFDPNGTITIAELATILNRTFTLYGTKVNYPYENNGHWSFSHFEELTSKGIIKSSDTYYYPYQPERIATRQDCAILLGRILLQYHEVVK